MPNEPRPISTLPNNPGFSFIGLILEYDIEGKPMWDIDHYQFVSGPKLMNCNSNNYTLALNMLTHWMPEPKFPDARDLNTEWPDEPKNDHGVQNYG